MQINDFWDDLGTIFQGHSDQIKEIELVNLKAGGMALCLAYLLEHAKDCSARFVLPGTETQVLLPSPQMVTHYVLQGQVSVAMWLTFPAIPLLSIYIDFPDQISFGYVRGKWDAMAVLAFFDLLYEMRQMAPGAEVHPSIYTFSADERQQILDFWQEYTHA